MSFCRGGPGGMSCCETGKGACSAIICASSCVTDMTVCLGLGASITGPRPLGRRSGPTGACAGAPKGGRGQGGPGGGKPHAPSDAPNAQGNGMGHGARRSGRSAGHGKGGGKAPWNGGLADLASGIEDNPSKRPAGGGRPWQQTF